MNQVTHIIRYYGRNFQGIQKLVGSEFSIEEIKEFRKMPYDEKLERALDRAIGLLRDTEGTVAKKQFYRTPRGKKVKYLIENQAKIGYNKFLRRSKDKTVRERLAELWEKIQGKKQKLAAQAV
jgi:hypothetical protein